MQLRQLGFNEAFQQAQLSLKANEFNARVALEAARENMANQLYAMNLDAKLIFEDVQFQLNQNAELNSALSNFIAGMGAFTG